MRNINPLEGAILGWLKSNPERWFRLNSNEKHRVLIETIHKEIDKDSFFTRKELSDTLLMLYVEGLIKINFKENEKYTVEVTAVNEITREGLLLIRDTNVVKTKSNKIEKLILLYLKNNSGIRSDEVDKVHPNVVKDFQCDIELFNHTVRMLVREGFIKYEEYSEDNPSSRAGFNVFKVMEITKEGLIALRNM